MNETQQRELNERLFDAIQLRQVQKARELIADGAKFNQSRYRDVPLCHAAMNGHIEIVEVLIEARADVSGNGKHALYLAAVNGHVEVVEALIKAGANASEVNLYDVGIMGCVKVVELLIEAGADVNGDDYQDTLLCWAAEKGSTEIVKVLIGAGADVNRTNRNRWALYFAAMNGHIEIVEVLIEAGADVNVVDEHGRSPLHWAAKNGHIGVAKALIKAGANVDIVNTMLHLAAIEGNIKEVKALIEIWADVDGACSEMTPLYRATANNHTEVAETLIKAGADVNKTNKHGKTPLHLAVQNDNIRLVGTLIEAGADVNAEDESESTALQLAVIRNEVDVCKSIVNHIIKLEAADLFVIEENLQRKNEFIQTQSNQDSYSRHLQNCKKEVKKIKEESKLLHDFLKASNDDELTSIWGRDKNVSSRFDNQESLKKQYPEYAHILMNKANKVKKEFFLHNNKPLIAALSAHYRIDFYAMTFTSIKNFFESHGNDYDFRQEAGVTLGSFANSQDITAKNIPTLKAQAFAICIRSNAMGTNLESPDAQQIQGVNQAPN